VSTTDTYSVEVSLADCTVSDSVFVEFNENPMIDLGADFETCFESPVLLDASPSNYPAEDASYVWTFNGIPLPDVTPVIEATEYGTYAVTVSVGICISQDSIVISPREDLEVSLGEAVSGCTSETIILTATTSEEGVSYTWFLNGNIIEGETSNSITITLPTTASNMSDVYSVEISKGECSGTAEVEATALNCILPEGISPNGDGLNDCFDIQFLDSRTGVDKFSIFNRYGNVVFERNGVSDLWCGISDDGDELP